MLWQVYRLIETLPVFTVTANHESEITHKCELAVLWEGTSNSSP